MWFLFLPVVSIIDVVDLSSSLYFLWVFSSPWSVSGSWVFEVNATSSIIQWIVTDTGDNVFVRLSLVWHPRHSLSRCTVSVFQLKAFKPLY